jgi:hypothetical protein
MKLPSFKRLFAQDYPKENQKLIDTLSVSLNNGIEVLYNALNGQITLRDNIKGTVKDVIVKVDTTGTPIQTAAFTLNSTSKIDAIVVGIALNQTNTAVYPTSQPFISGTQAGTIFTISNISGLQANQQYLLRVTVYQQ